MKTVLAVLGQLILFALFVAIFFAGGFLHLFGFSLFYAQWFLSHPTATTMRFFVPTGLILMTILYLIVVGIEAAAKRVRTAGLWTTVAFMVALVVGLVAKFGWVQTS